MSKATTLLGGLLLLFIVAGPASAQSAGIVAGEDPLQPHLNVVWTCVAAFLVMFMQAGFAMVETGFTRAKNAVNILMKNIMDFSVGSVVFFLIGFGLMFGTTTTGWFGTDGFALSDISVGADGWSSEWLWTFLIFQTVFCATAATIVSGAMAERTKFVGLCAASPSGLSAVRRTLARSGAFKSSQR